MYLKRTSVLLVCSLFLLSIYEAKPSKRGVDDRDDRIKRECNKDHQDLLDKCEKFDQFSIISHDDINVIELQKALFKYLTELKGRELKEFNRNECDKQELVLRAIEKLRQATHSSFSLNPLIFVFSGDQALFYKESSLWDLDVLLGRLNDRIRYKNARFDKLDRVLIDSENSYGYENVLDRNEKHSERRQHRERDRSYRKDAKDENLIKRQLQSFKELEALCLDPTNGIERIASEFKDIINPTNSEGILFKWGVSSNWNCKATVPSVFHQFGSSLYFLRNVILREAINIEFLYRVCESVRNCRTCTFNYRKFDRQVNYLFNHIFGKFSFPGVNTVVTAAVTSRRKRSTDDTQSAAVVLSASDSIGKNDVFYFDDKVNDWCPKDKPHDSFLESLTGEVYSPIPTGLYQCAYTFDAGFKDCDSLKPKLDFIVQFTPCYDNQEKGHHKRDKYDDDDEKPREYKHKEKKKKPYNKDKSRSSKYDQIDYKVEPTN